MSDTIDVRNASSHPRYIRFAEPERGDTGYGYRFDLLNAKEGFAYLDEGDSGDTVRVHKDDIDNMIVALNRLKELLK
jgi:hypothetical protein